MEGVKDTFVKQKTANALQTRWLQERTRSWVSKPSLQRPAQRQPPPAGTGGHSDSVQWPAQFRYTHKQLSLPRC